MNERCMSFYCGGFPLFSYVWVLFVWLIGWFLFNWCVDLLLAMLFGCLGVGGGLLLCLSCFLFVMLSCLLCLLGCLLLLLICCLACWSR